MRRGGGRVVEDQVPSTFTRPPDGEEAEERCSGAAGVGGRGSGGCWSRTGAGGVGSDPDALSGEGSGVGLKCCSVCFWERDIGYFGRDRHQKLTRWVHRVKLPIFKIFKQKPILL
ncbi:hypothetical protein F2P81_010826 [Scophthalmus maximus]|uniref:Uncharacterized protein n=1 Tax=Scophthalmus maximus TaxID=52904 RepID=A0A6A4T6Y7_SCOMX|nr:hypothetical protein F2P81_010826 [Scophthalmus maximus]